MRCGCLVCEGGKEEDVKLLLSSRNVNANEAGPTGFGLTTQRRRSSRVLDWSNEVAFTLHTHQHHSLINFFTLSLLNSRFLNAILPLNTVKF